MVNDNSKGRKARVGKRTHCTSFGVCEQVTLKDFKPPPDLKTALKNSLVEQSRDTQLCRNYIRLINSLKNIRKIEPEHYLTLFNIFLYMEDYELQSLVSKHNLKGQDLVPMYDMFQITVPTLDENDPLINIGDTVKLELPNMKCKISTKIMDIVGKKVFIAMSKKAAKIFLGQKTDVHFHAFNWTIRCSHYVLHIIFKYNLINLIYPEICSYDRTIHQEDLDWVHESVAKNPEQKMAVINILNSSAYPAPYILFGPPGTGKTTTLVEAICQIRSKYRSNSILVCASSNTAADEIAKRLLLVLPQKDIFRMYAASRPGSSIDKKIKQSSNFIDDTVLYLPKEIFITKKIVITTLVTCVRLVKLKLRNDHFSHIFIDEASQSTELESLIPLAVMNSQNATAKGTMPAQIIIAGDPHQLGPIIRCKKIDHLLGKSLLERLLECKPYQKVDNKYNTRYITKLLRNYRSHEAILHVPNKLFYDNELICCYDANANKVTTNWPILSSNPFPILFLIVKGQEERTISKSVYNLEEIEVVIECTKKLMSAKIGTRKVCQADIGIITPFKQQKLMIEKELNEHKLKNITVGTVETFQGQEREIMLLSTVRTQSFMHDGREHLGFLSSHKRFNVALTRAKNLLIIIGDATVLCKDRCWKKLWRYCTMNACNIHIGK